MLESTHIANTSSTKYMYIWLLKKDIELRLNQTRVTSSNDVNIQLGMYSKIIIKFKF